MTKYNQIRVQIAKLEREAESLRRKEIKHVVQQIRRLMAEHNLTLDDLREPRSRKGAKKAVAAKAKRKPAAKKRRSRASKVKYRSPDKKSLTWSGMGRQPKWIAELLASGKTLDDLRVND